MELHPGDAFGRYTIEAVLGEGGMGRVYRAHDTLLDRRVALKILLAGAHVGADASDGPARLLREARTAAAFDHPNVVAIFDVGEADGVAFIAMELVDGVSLRRHVGDAGVPLARKLRWLLDVARTLEAAHARGLVHRDVKPENVMVRADGVVKVLDFGIARRVSIAAREPATGAAASAAAAAGIDPKGPTQSAPAPANAFDATTLTQQGTLVGTPIYMAPEQVRGDPFDSRVDQYAWGVTAYELLTGTLPFELKHDTLQLVAEIFSREPPPLRGRDPLIPVPVETAVLRALSKDPRKRFASMGKVAARLEPFAQEARPPQHSMPSDPPPSHTKPSDPPPSHTKPMTPFAAAAPAPPRATRALRAGGLVLACAVALSVAALVVGRQRREATRDASSSSTSVPAPAASTGAAPTPITSLPAPASSNAEALAAYRAGMQATRDASMDAAQASFERAAELDPAFAAALLRASLATFDSAPGEARAAFQRAAQLRTSLSDHDQVLLDAMEPYVQRQPSDFAEWERRLARAVASAPADADFLYWLGNARVHSGELDAGLEAYQRAAEVDPKFARALWAKGETLAYLGRFDEAHRALDACLDGSPGATSCMQVEAWIDEQQLRCADVETTAKRWIATDGSSAAGYDLLAQALFARGRPIDAVEAALGQKWARTKDAARATTEGTDRAALALVEGRFDEAETRAKKLERMAAGEVSLDAHARPALLLVHIYEETGREADAAHIADEFLKRSEAYVADPREQDFALAKDATPEMIAVLARAGRIGAPEAAARREAWLAQWKGLAPVFRPYLWIHGFARPAQRADEARGALDALPAYEPLPPFRPLTFADGDIGRTNLLAGDAGAALPGLEHAAASCVALAFPIASTRAHLFLGEAREAKGDAAGACDAYGAVISRWGDAPRSLSAAHAKERATALGCRR